MPASQCLLTGEAAIRLGSVFNQTDGILGRIDVKNEEAYGTGESEGRVR